MIDWNWLWVAGELGISYGFYRWWKADDKFLAILAVAPDIDINDLKQLPSSNAAIDYAIVHGLVRRNDSKTSSVLSSQFLPHCLGVIHRLTIREKKLEKFRTVWAETNKTISDATRYVSFRLASQTGNYVRVDQPLAFDSIVYQLDVTHVKFEPNTTSSFQRIVDTFLGDLTTGIETKEQMLLLDLPLTGVGRLEKRSDSIWHLVPHERWGGILTRSSRAEIVAEYRDRSSLARIISICFGVAALGTAAYFLYTYYSSPRRRARTTRLPRILPDHRAETTDRPANTQLRCIICLENEIIYSLQPCSHLGLCHSCAQALQSRGRREELCPLCRTPIEEYQRVFLS